MKKAVLKRVLSMTLTLVMLLGMIPAVTVSAAGCSHEAVTEVLASNYNGTHTTKVVCDDCGAVVEADATRVVAELDFKAFAKAAAKQDWWQDLAYILTANGYETRRIGSFRNRQVTDTELAAYEDMLQWLSENACWNFTMSEWERNNKTDGRRAYLCADDGIAWGISMHTYAIGGGDSSNFVWSVEVPESGFYDLTMAISRQDNAASDNPNDENIYPGGASIDVSVNGELMLDNSEVAKGQGLVEHTIERVWLEKGSNDLAIELVSNYANISGFGSRTNLNLKSMVLSKAENCVDDNADEICDICNGSLKPCEHDGETSAKTAYNGDKTHTVTVTCEQCKAQVSETAVDCTDADEDGKCDICAGKIGSCRHKGEQTTKLTYNNDKTHTTKVTCNVCKGTVSTVTDACVDEREDGVCDICGGVIGDCAHRYYEDVCFAYGNGTHLVEETCEGCGLVSKSYAADCTDADQDGICENCDGSMGKLIPDTITLDFKDFAKNAQQQPFWADLRTAVNENTKYIGLDRGTDTTSAAEQAAYDAMIAWAKETYGWTIDEDISGFKHYFKRLYLNGQDDIPWGLCMYCYYHGTGDYPERSKLALTVEADVAGWYQVDLSSFLMESAWPQAGNTIEGGSSGGDRVAVYVNGEEIFYDYAMVGKYLVATHNMGAAYLKAGENTVVIDSIFSYNNLGTGGRSNVPLVEMAFTPLSGVQVQEYLTASIDLKSTYLPYNTAFGGLTAAVSNDLIATASLSAGGVLTVSGITEGTAEISILNGEEVLCVVPVRVGSFAGSVDELRGSAAKIDFMTFADRAVEQPWWDTLSEAAEGIRNITTSDADALAWLEDNTRWSLAKTEGSVTVNGTDAKYGLGVDGKVELIVDIPASGLYNLTVEYLQGSGQADISVNGTDIRKGLSAAGTEAAVKRSLGTVELSKGSNTVTVDGTMQLRALILTPMGMRQVEQGGAQYVPVRETYLAFDEDVSGLTAVSDNTDVATAAFDADGDLVIYGKSLGSAVITVSGGSVRFTVPVTVVEKREVEYVSYLLDGLRAVTLKQGEKAVGEVSGMTVGQTQLAEKYLRAYGAVYFTTSDRSVAVVDQTTGDVTCVAEGTAVVTVYTVVDGVSASASVTLTVTDDTDLEGIEVASAVDFLGTDNSMQLTVSGVKASGAAADMTKFPIAWSVDDETVAVISETGRLTGLKPGKVTVTATAGVMRMPIMDTHTIEVVDNAELPGEAVFIQLAAGRVLDLFEATLARDGYMLVTEETYNGGEGMLFDAQGLRFKVPAEAALTIDFTIKTSGWYQPTVQAKQLKDAGSICNVFVDDSFIGIMDSRSANSNGGAGGVMNAIYLTAGVHRLRVVSTMEALLMLGRAYFYPTSAPAPVELEIQAKQELVVGEAVELAVSAEDANSLPVKLLQEAQAPDYTNFYTVTSSNTRVVMVSGTTLRAVSEGTAQITVEGEMLGEHFSRTLTVTVKAGSFISAALTAESTTVKPDAAPFALQVVTYDRGGNAMESIPEGISITYACADPAVASVSEVGIVTLTGKEGSALITATLTEGDRIVEATMWLMVTEGKTAPTVYTYEERAIAQENVLKYT